MGRAVSLSADHASRRSLMKTNTHTHTHTQNLVSFTFAFFLRCWTIKAHRIQRKYRKEEQWKLFPHWSASSHAIMTRMSHAVLSNLSFRRTRNTPLDLAVIWFFWHSTQWACQHKAYQLSAWTQFSTISELKSHNLKIFISLIWSFRHPLEIKIDQIAIEQQEWNNNKNFRKADDRISSLICTGNFASTVHPQCCSNTLTRNQRSRRPVVPTQNSYCT